jgi:hypothetical protein
LVGHLRNASNTSCVTDIIGTMNQGIFGRCTHQFTLGTCTRPIGKQKYSPFLRPCRFPAPFMSQSRSLLCMQGGGTLKKPENLQLTHCRQGSSWQTTATEAATTGSESLQVQTAYPATQRFCCKQRHRLLEQLQPRYRQRVLRILEEPKRRSTAETCIHAKTVRTRS